MSIDVIRLAKEAGMSDVVGSWCQECGLQDEMLERFAALVMEECAKVCENLPMQQAIDVRDQAAAAIRAKKPA